MYRFNSDSLCCLLLRSSSYYSCLSSSATKFSSPSISYQSLVMSSNSNHLGTALSRPSTPTGIRRSIPEHAESVREALAKEKANNASLGTHSIASPVLSSVQWDGIVHHANATNDACDRLVKAIKTHRPQRGPVQAESSEQVSHGAIKERGCC